LDFRPFPQTLQRASQTAQFVLQTDARRVVRLGIEDLVDVCLDLGCSFSGVAGERLGHEFHVERGLHELGQGDGG
jgi:hypothetical protein